MAALESTSGGSTCCCSSRLLPRGRAYPSSAPPPSRRRRPGRQPGEAGAGGGDRGGCHRGRGWRARRLRHRPPLGPSAAGTSRQAPRAPGEIIERGKKLYARWGWLAVFFTPAIVSGTAKMRPYQFAFWNLLDSLGWTVSVAASAYGVQGSATGHHTGHDIAILVIGLGAGALVTVAAVRRHRRRTARLLGAPASGTPDDPS